MPDQISAPSPSTTPSSPPILHLFPPPSPINTPNLPLDAPQHPSKTVLTTALAKAQAAVLLDTSLQIPEAIVAYTEAVLLLEEVIDKIDEMAKEREQSELDSLLRDQARDRIWAQELCSNLSSNLDNTAQRDQIEARLRDRERKWHEKRWKMEKRKKARADEEDRLVGIHNTYASRIRELEAELSSARIAAQQSLDSNILFQTSYSPAQSIFVPHHPDQLTNKSSIDPDSFSPNPSLDPALHHSPSLQPSPLLEPTPTTTSTSTTTSTTTSTSTSTSTTTSTTTTTTMLDLPLLPINISNHDSSDSNLSAQSDRKSFGSDSTTRDGPQLQPPSYPSIQPSSASALKPKFTRLHTSSNPSISSLPTLDPPPPSLDIAAEEDDVVPERLPSATLPNTAPQSSRNRSSSSISGASLSRIERAKSNESISTSTRTSVSSAAIKPDHSNPLISSSEPQDGSTPHPRRRLSAINSASIDPHPTCHQSSRSSRAPSITLHNETPKLSIGPSSSTVLPLLQHDSNLNLQAPSQKLLVSDTVTHGTISQRRRSPGDSNPCHRSSDSTFADNDQTTGPLMTVEHSPLSITPQTCSSLPQINRRPSNILITPTVPAPAIPLRLRSYSQPGKRPGLPAFMFDQSPPMPSNPALAPTGPPHHAPHLRMSRKSSAPISTTPYDASLFKSSTSAPIPTFQLRSTSPTSSSPFPMPANHSADNSTSKSSEPPTSFPSAIVYSIQPYAHASIRTGSICGTSETLAGALPPYPASAARRPFHLMGQIRAAILTGAYVSPRLYVPRQMWYQGGVKLHGLETKIKLMETVLSGMELVERDGEGMVRTSANGKPVDAEGEGEERRRKAGTSAQVLNLTERFLRRLEAFEELLDGLQHGVAKKLGLHGSGPQETAYGQDRMRKAGGFGTLMAQKLGKGLDRITNAKSTVELPMLYVETIARLFEKSQVIDSHLASLDQAARPRQSRTGVGSNGSSTSVSAGLYGAVGQQSRVQIESRLKKVSEFYSTVVCRFVVADMGVLLDKYVKRGGNWCGD